MKLNGKDFYCPNSGICICVATGKKKPNKKCVDMAKNITKTREMNPQEPAEGILKQGDFGPAKFYYVQCECCNDDCSHTVEVEADDMRVQIYLYSNHHTKWWEMNRWKQIWQILTKGYAEMQTTIVLSEQTALNYSNVLKSAVTDVKQFRDERKTK